jgi:HAD superfamily hydrolase (TIGR01509 family)
VSVVLLDFDGTVLDTESTVLASWAEEYAAQGLPFDHAAWCARVGVFSEDEPYAELAALVGEHFDVAGAHRRRRAREDELVLGLPVKPGVLDLLDGAAARGVPVAVVSSSPYSWVGGHLERLGLLGRVATVVTRGDAARSKPAPDLYVEALRRLGAPPQDAMAIEDSAPGVAAARAAGVRVVAVPNEITAGHDFSSADVVVATLAGLDLDAVLAGRPQPAPDQLA